MRVALIDPSLFTLPYDTALATGLRAAGHEVVLHGRKPRGDDGATNGFIIQESFYRISSLRLIDAMPKPLRLGIKGMDHVISMVELRARLARERPDIIHFQWLPLPVVDQRFLGGMRRIAPIVLTVHDSEPFNGNPAAGLQRRGTGRSFALCDRIIVHTERGRERLVAQGVPATRIAILPHGLLASGTPDPAVDRMEGDIVFLLFGKIKEYKGLDLLIEAFARMPAELQAVSRLRVIGKPYMNLTPLITRAQELGIAPRVSIEPRFAADEEIPTIFAPSTIATFPYREIDASGVLSLAIAYGRPILASRLGGFAEIIRDGIDGALVPPGNIDALAKAMARCVAERDYVAACARNVRQLAESIPGWHAIGCRTAAVYAEALQASDRAGSRAGVRRAS